MGHKLKRAMEVLIVVVQRIVITICLTLVYLVGLGLARAAATVLSRRSLADSAPAGASTYWLPAEDYREDPEQARRQS